MRALAVVFHLAVALLLGGGLTACGESAQSCETTCDCTQTDAPMRCPGEWVCNADKLCEYSCKGQCSEFPYTCRSEETCNGTFCSERAQLCE